MTTIIERDVNRSDEGSSSGMTAIVGIIAILVIVGIALYMFRMYPTNANGGTNERTPVNINVTTPTAPGTNY